MMTPLKFAGILAASLMLAGAARPARAQNAVTSADIQRLEDNIFNASRDIEIARARDTAFAVRLQGELDDARDETMYLKVKLRKNEPIARREYSDLRDRIETIRSRARGDGGAPAHPPAAAPEPDRRPEPPAPRAPSGNDIPVGTEFDVRLQTSLSSATAQVEDRFDATTIVDLRDERGRVLVPAGSLMRGIVSSVTKTTRSERTGKLTVAFDRVTIDGRAYPIRATVEQAIESEGIKGEAGKIGTGAGVGAILGAILGGAKGAIAGILIGGGGTMAATEGKDVELPPGTTLRVRLDSGLTLQR
jgi:hypothetical protein